MLFQLMIRISIEILLVPFLHLGTMICATSNSALEKMLPLQNFILLEISKYSNIAFCINLECDFGELVSFAQSRY